MSSINVPATDQFSIRNDLRRFGASTDVTVKIADHHFPCHRVILASAIEYFRNELAKNPDVIELSESLIEPHHFELLLQRVYGDSVKLNNGGDAYGLLRVTYHLHPEGLEDLYAYYRANIESIPLDTLVFMYKFIEGQKEDGKEHTFAPAVAQHLTKNFSIAVESDDSAFFELSGKELLTVFQQPNFNATPVDRLLFLSRWAKSDAGDRCPWLSDLMQFVNTHEVHKKAWAKIMAENLGVSIVDRSSVASSSGVESENSSLTDDNSDA